MATAHHCDHSERVIVLETEVAALKETLKEILTTVKEIDDQMTRYKGFIGGIAFVISAVGVLWSLLKDWLLSLLK